MPEVERRCSLCRRFYLGQHAPDCPRKGVVTQIDCESHRPHHWLYGGDTIRCQVCRVKQSASSRDGECAGWP